MDAESYAAWCLGVLPSPMLTDEFTRQVLEDFYAAVGDAEAAAVEPARAGIPLFLDPMNCPAVAVHRDDGAGTDLGPTGEDALDCLLSLTGFKDLGWLQGLAEATRRKLAQVGVALWKMKGTPDGARAMATIFTGRDPVILDWPWVRYAVDDALPILDWPDPSEGGEQEAILHLSDPLLSADRDRAALALKTMKPGTDRWSLVWCLLAEPWLQGLYQWTVTGAPTWVPGQVTLGNGDALVSPFNPTTWSVGRFIAEFQRSGSGTTAFEFARLAVDSYWKVQVTPTLVQVGIVKDGGYGVVLAVGATIAPDVWYRLGVHLATLTSGAVECRLFLDGELLGSGTVY